MMKINVWIRRCKKPEAPELKVDLASKLWLDFKAGFISFHVENEHYHLDGVRETWATRRKSCLTFEGY